MHWIYLIHEFHNLSWITEINELFHDILIYWDAPVNVKWKALDSIFKHRFNSLHKHLLNSLTVFWEIILTWMHRGPQGGNLEERLILKTLCNKQKQDRNPSVKTGVQLVSHSLWPPWSAGPQTPSQGNVFQMELFKTENTEKCLLKMQAATDDHKYPADWVSASRNTKLLDVIIVVPLCTVWVMTPLAV